MDTPDSLQPEILNYYNAGQEAGRLETPFSQWEKIRTFDLLERFLPSPPAVILDVGGAAGAYAFPLAEKGYIVDLIDPVPLHIDQALLQEKKSRCAPRSYHVGDARSIPAGGETADAVLFFGPLYHLTDRSDRLLAIREAHRVLRARGLLMAVAISRFASAMDGIGRGLIRDAEFLQIVEHDLNTGQHRNETANLDYFTTAFFHHPDEFKTELIEAGFPDATIYAVEGPLWNVALPNSPGERNRLMAAVQMIECEPSLVGASAHMMGIARKPH
jgi:SAM-dependent methyltransferase